MRPDQHEHVHLARAVCCAVRRILAIGIVLLFCALSAAPALAQPSAHPTVVRFDEDDLFGASGWLLVAFRVIGGDTARLDAGSSPVYTDGIEAHGIVTHDGSGVPHAVFFSDNDRGLGAAAGGVAVRCCTDELFAQRAAGARVGWYATEGADGVAYVAFFHANWHPGSRLWLNITAPAGGGIEVVRVDSSWDTQVIDLVGRAYDAGTNVRAAPDMIGYAAPQEGVLEFDAPGIFAAAYYPRSGTATFRIDLPDGTTLENTDDAYVWAQAWGAPQAGEHVSWRVDDVRSDRPDDVQLYVVRVGLALPGAAGFDRFLWEK